VKLWYKAWRESQVRFLLLASMVAGLCAVFVLFHVAINARIHASVAVPTYVGYIYGVTYAGSVRGLFTLLSPLLGLGGLQRERAQHTDGFTLALPVSRRALLAARVVVGVLQIVVVSLLPAMVICGLSPLVQASYPWLQALQFSVLWAVVGSAGFAAWVFASVVFSSEYTALTVCWVASFFAARELQRPSVRPLHLAWNYIMSGRNMPYFDARTDQLIGPIPIEILLVQIVIALSFLVAAAWVLDRQDFA
jgi:ABC-type transport system involved in multi-copper enzyme maturation permease subunit